MTPLRFVDDTDDYFRDPAGACLRRTRFFCSSPDAKLFSLFAWGHLDERDTHELFEIFAAAERSGGPPRRQLVVLRRVESVTMDSMGKFMRYYQRGAQYLQTVAQEAVVRPGGLVGILSEGFYPAIPRPFPGKVFSSLPRAVDWLGFAHEELDGWLAQVTELERATACPIETTLHDLRLVILTAGARVSVAEVARSLSVSVRTLQRRIKASGTTFEQVRRAVCLTEAQRRLATSDDDVKRIALDLGYASPNRLTEAFVGEFGVSPTRWRHASRDAPSKPSP